MGYNITIGNATLQGDKFNFPQLNAYWDVDRKSLPDAPVFLHDELTGSTNCRSPTYSAWTEFCRATGLYDLFFHEEDGLIVRHPGCRGITQQSADEVTQALVRYRRRAKLAAGFHADSNEGTPTVDPYFARLIWLEYWMQWAVKNCETPAIRNT